MPELDYALFADELTRHRLSYAVKMQSDKYKLRAPRLIVGGFSAGESVALSYAEYLLSSDSVTNLRGVFIIDSPLDLERMYISTENKINYNCGKLIANEAYFTKNYLNSALAGSPQSQLANYLKNSPYLATANDGGNAKWLENIALKLYTEPDLEFVKKTYCEELVIEDINASDLKKLSDILSRVGSKKIEYIVTQGRGFHSWNIVEPNDFSEWVVRISN